MRKGLTVLAALTLVVNGLGGVEVKAETPGTTPAAVERVMPRLVVGQEKAATIEGNEKQIYDIPMEKGQYLELIVEQKNVDVIVTLFDPQGQQVMESDFTGRSEEFVLFIAEQTDNYRLQVRRYEQDSIRGNYGVQVAVLRSASQSDKAKASAYQAGSQALVEGLELLKVSQPVSSQQALTKFKTALSSFQGLQQPAMIGVALKLIGYSYSSLQEYPQALDAYQQALPNLRQANELVSEADALQGIGSVYLAQGDKKRATEYTLKALDLYSKMPDRLWDRRGALQQLAIIYRESEKYAQSVTVLEEVLLLDRQLKDNQGEGLTLYFLGMTYKDVGQNQEAINAYEQSLKINQQLGQQDGQKAILEALADVYQRQGNQATAEDYQRQALAMTDQPQKIDPSPPSEAQKLFDEGIQLFSQGTAESRQQAIKKWEAALPLYKAVGDREGEATTLNNIGRIYSDLGEKQKALDYYSQALPLRKAVGDRAGEATTLNNIGAVYDDLGEKQKALDYYSQALPLSKAVGDRGGEAATLNNIGAVYNALGEKQKALEYYSQALPLFKAVGDREGEAATLNNIGAVYNALGEKQKALDYYSQALPLYKAVGDRAGEATTLYNVAYLERSRGNLQAALQPIQESIAIVEELRAKIIDPDLRQSYFATVQENYQFYIELLMELHQQNPSQGYDKQAFNISERSRARTLLELLTEANANIKEGVDPQLLAQEKSLLLQLDATEKQRIQINSNPKSSPEQKANIDQQYKDLQTQYQALQTQIRAKSPKYAALKYPQPLTLAQVQQQLLDPDAALLQYSLGKDKSYLWVVTQDGFQSYVLPASKELKTTAENLLKLIQFGKDYAEEITQLTNQLSQQILAPATDKLNKKRLIIVPDGVLNYLPFSVLAVNNQPLLSNHELINLPSSSSLALIRQETQNRKPAPKALAILADPIFSRDDSRLKTPPKPVAPTNPDVGTLALNRAAKVVKKTRAVGDNNVFTRIPGTRQEANAILTLLPRKDTQAAFDDQANLPLATNPQLSQYRIIHLATHGIFNTQEPALSGIILSLVDQQGKPVNGFLRLNDIFNLNLPAELVVLSACETGLGEEIKGEGLVGLTRGFMYAGTPRVLVSLWKVDDDATAAIMTRFYKLMLEKKLPAAQALREAQLQMQNETEWKSPYYWSAFVLQGEWR